MATGKVKWFNDQKGFGFIKPDEGGADIFVHISAVERSGLRTLAEDQAVSYELFKDERRGKTSAVDLKVL
ncbi:MAG: cold-shock protein [Hyphomonadaceae bacterium BRH_c29]|jgi:CspA family cold shock protein|nr:MAG: cold-shock protein [Hyphomonadaceae bacterium BRH_c29]